MMTKAKNKAILNLAKSIFKNAKKNKKTNFINTYCTWENYNIISDGFRMLATTASLDEIATENIMINSITGIVEGSERLPNTAYLPNVDELRNAIETINTEGKQKEIQIVFSDICTLNAYWLYEALQAVTATEFKYLDARHQIMLEDNESRYIIMPIGQLKIEKKGKRTYKTWVNSKPTDSPFIYVDNNGTISIIDPTTSIIEAQTEPATETA